MIEVAGERKPVGPESVKRITEAVAAAKEEVINKSALDALMNTRPEDLIAPDEEGEVIKGNARRSGCWLHSPALLDLFAAADKRLSLVGKWAGIEAKLIPKVQVRLIPGTRVVTIKAAHADDLTAIPVHRYGSAVTINLISLLGEHDLKVEAGWRERYDVAFIPKGSPHWPGLFIDLNDVKERRQESEPKKAKGEPSSGEQQSST